MDIKDVINEDIKLWENLHNKESMIESYLYLHEYSDSKESGWGVKLPFHEIKNRGMILYDRKN